MFQVQNRCSWLVISNTISSESIITSTCERFEQDKKAACRILYQLNPALFNLSVNFTCYAIKVDSNIKCLPCEDNYKTNHTQNRLRCPMTHWYS